MRNYAISLSSSTYKNHILDGFSHLQQNDEFVDMTLAADGHWVKVHRMLIALASPYFRELLQSLPCQHPIIYLYGVSHEALGFILEYLYTGQVEIPAEKVQSFLNTAKDMQIAGLKNAVAPDENEDLSQEKKRKDIFNISREPPSTARVNYTSSNEINTDFELQVPSIVIPVKGNKNEENEKSSLPINMSIPLDGSNAFQNASNLAPSILTNIMLNESAATNKINQAIRNNEFQTNRNRFTPNKTINITLDESIATSDVNLDLGSNEVQNIRDINAPNQVINVTLDESAVTNDNIKQLQISNEYQSISHINAPGKTINITLDESASNDNIRQKPVANIEILSNTLISSHYTNEVVNVTEQGQLPELYAQALAKLYNPNTSTNHESKTQSGKSSNRSLMDISQLLDFRDNVPMVEDKGSELLETPAQTFDNEEINANVNTTNNEQIDLTIQQETDSMLYTFSNRGALQLIMNRFMYYCHYQRDNGRKRRWRCIDYRDKKCLAAIDTNGEEIVARKHKHCHPNHDDKIRRKMAKEKLKIFATIQMAQDAMKRK